MITRAHWVPWALVLVVSVAGCGSSSGKASGVDGAASGEDGAMGAAGTGGGGAGMSGGGGAGISGGGGAGMSGGAGGAGAMTLAVARACPGVAMIPAGVHACRTSADCPPDSIVCQQGFFTNACPACAPAHRACETDGDCGTSKACLPVQDRKCPCPGSTICVARCSGTLCGSDQVCDAQGKCANQPCTDGYTCPADLVCAPNRPYPDPHGCNTPTCSADGYKCPDGFTCTPGPSADGYGCSPVSCVGGAFKCPVNTDCTPNSTAAHQCVQRACKSDTDCDCGACIAGKCEDGLFVCSQPPTP